MTANLQSNPDKFSQWFNGIIMNRLKNCGKSVAEFPFASCRVRLLCGTNDFHSTSDNVSDGRPCIGSVVYWMNRDQRIQDNWALLFAQRIALKFSVPLHVCFNFLTSSALKTRRHATFLLEGLADVEEECQDLDIGFHVLFPSNVDVKFSAQSDANGDPHCDAVDFEVAQPIIDCLRRLDARVLVTDFSPLREDLHHVQSVSSRLPEHISLYQVDAHNVVPAWVASGKLEYAARTIRRKLHEKAKHLFTDFPPIIRHPVAFELELLNWDRIRELLANKVDEAVRPVTWAKGGTKAGFNQLFAFLKHRLHGYAKDRNDPSKDVSSNLSPWLHFGHLSPQRCLWEAKLFANVHKESVDAFIEEGFVRRELSDNFCYYNTNYDSIRGAWPWAQETLRKHANDFREPSYTAEVMEAGTTDDELWNAAQRQLCREGKMHGFLRMYWAKKILEWHAGGPEQALQLGFRLNDRYALDGTDPNGYVGVMWSICGIHDQGWGERPKFGKIRYMNFEGCKRKFDVNTFIRMYPP